MWSMVQRKTWVFIIFLLMFLSWRQSLGIQTMSAQSSQTLQLSVEAETFLQSLPGEWLRRDEKLWVPGEILVGYETSHQRQTTRLLTDLGVEVVGISGDSVKTHELFKKAQKLNFTLLADEAGKVAKMFGVPFGKGGMVKTKDADAKPIEIERAGTAARWTFLIGKDGKIAYKNIKVIPAQDAKAITEFIDKAEKK